MEATTQSTRITTITTTSRSTRRPGPTPSATPGCSGSSSRCALHRLGLGRADRPRRLLVASARCSSSSPSRCSTSRSGWTPTNPPDSVLKWLEQDRYYRWCTYAFIPIQYAGLVFACWLWSSGDLSMLESLGLALTMGVVGGIAINTAHELGHKRASSERWLPVALAQTGYGHFFIEHNRGHHVRVATPEDPASSRLGESFWAFLPRTVAGSLRSAWELEGARLDRIGKSHWSLRNDILNAWAMTVVLFAVLASSSARSCCPTC